MLSEQNDLSLQNAVLHSKILWWLLSQTQNKIPIAHFIWSAACSFSSLSIEALWFKFANKFCFVISEHFFPDNKAQVMTSITKQKNLQTHCPDEEKLTSSTAISP